MSNPHEYLARIIWDGNEGQGTSTYTSYGRQYRIQVDGKPELVGSADPAFRGQADRHNPEDLFLGAISACHMLTYLALCARRGIRVVAYEDNARGTMSVDAQGGGRFEEVTLHPQGDGRRREGQGGRGGATRGRSSAVLHRKLVQRTDSP